MITFRAVVAQALADALQAGDAKAMAAELPLALKRRMREAGYVVKRAVPDEVVGRPLEEVVHAAHHPEPVRGCFACEARDATT